MKCTSRLDCSASTVRKVFFIFFYKVFPIGLTPFPEPDDVTTNLVVFHMLKCLCIASRMIFLLNILPLFMQSYIIFGFIYRYCMNVKRAVYTPRLVVRTIYSAAQSLILALLTRSGCVYTYQLKR